MATLLEGVLERHEGPEPRVVTEDVKRILADVTKQGEADGGESVQLIAEKAQVSTRTVYRVLKPTSETISLHLADKLCLAADRHLVECRLRWPDGTETPYSGVDL